MASIFLRANHGTNLHSFILNLVTASGLKDAAGIKTFEEVLGIIDFCLDLEIYKSGEDFYVVVGYAPEDVEKINKLNPDFIEILTKEFLLQMKKGFEHIPLGTGNYHKTLIRIETLYEFSPGVRYKGIRYEWWTDKEKMEQGIYSEFINGRQCIYYSGYAGANEEELLRQFDKANSGK